MGNTEVKYIRLLRNSKIIISSSLPNNINLKSDFFTQTEKCMLLECDEKHTNVVYIRLHDKTMKLYLFLVCTEHNSPKYKNMILSTKRTLLFK